MKAPERSKLTDAIRVVVARLRLRLSKQEVKIHELVQNVCKNREDGEALFPWSEEALLALYQKQFITQAALCELYFEYASEEGQAQELCFTAISVYLRDMNVKAEVQAEGCEYNIQESQHYSPNVDFYLNFENFYLATVDSVQTLLQSFWQKYDSFIAQEPALSILGLEQGASWSDIQQQYRRLARQHHPDKGGDPKVFVEIRQAFESLKRIQ